MTALLILLAVGGLIVVLGCLTPDGTTKATKETDNVKRRSDARCASLAKTAESYKKAKEILDRIKQQREANQRINSPYGI